MSGMDEETYPQEADSDGFTTKLCTILMSLAKGQTVHDDTLLSKLLDLLFTRSSLQIEKEPIERLLSWGTSKECEPQVTAFCLRLCAWLLQCNLAKDGANQMLRDIPQAASWRQAVVRAGWVECLAKLISSSAEIPFKEETVRKLWQCLWDDSLFVGQAAEKAACHLLLMDEEDNATAHGCPSISSMIGDVPNTMYGSDLSPVLRVINRALQEEFFSLKSASGVDLLNKLMTQVLSNWDTVSDQDAAVNLLCHQIRFVVQDENTETRALDICEFLVDKREIGLLIKLAALIYKKFPDIIWLRQLICLPIHVHLKQPGLHGDFHLLEKLSKYLKRISNPSSLLFRCVYFMGSLKSDEDTLLLLLDLLESCCDPEHVNFQAPVGAQRTKLLSAILDSFSKLLPISSFGNASKGETLLLRLLKTETEAPSIISKTYCCVKLLLTLSCCSDEFLKDLRPCVLRHLCDLHWENRDSALQFLCDLLKTLASKHGTGAHKLYSLDLTSSVWHSLNDTEPYVRSSAINFFEQLLDHDSLLEVLPESIQKNNIIEKLLAILKEDPSEFPRRAVIRVLCTWHKEGLLKDQWELVAETLPLASQDADWEVKLGVLQIWEIVLAKWYGKIQGAVENDFSTQNGCTHSKGEEFTQENVKEFTLGECVKSDNPNYSTGGGVNLQQKHKLNDEVSETSIPAKRKKDAPVNESELVQSTNDKQCHSLTEITQTFLKSILKWKFDKIILEGIEDNERSVKLKACEMGIILCKNLLWHTGKDAVSIDSEKFEMDSCSNSHCGTYQSFVEASSKFKQILCSVDLEETVRLCSSSSDEHIRNPVSVLDDLVTVLESQQTTQASGEEKVVIDCY